MKKKNLFITLIVLTVLLISGCLTSSKEQGSQSSMIGYWKHADGSGFEITDTFPKTISIYNNASKQIAFKGRIVSYLNDTARTGFITIEITECPSRTGIVNCFTRMHWKNLANNKCKVCIAVKNIGTSKEAAEELFTLASGQFPNSHYSNMVKQ